MITVANIRTTKTGEYIGRAMPQQGLKGSPLGNPYKLSRSEQRKPGARSSALLMYRFWLKDCLASDTPQRREFMRLVDLARAGDLTLLCWCAPESCHGDVLKQAIESYLAR